MAEGNEVNMDTFQLPSDKPLKVNGTEIEYIEIVPKGVADEYPQPGATDAGTTGEMTASQKSNGSEPCTELREQIQKLSEEKTQLEKEKGELKAQLSAIKEEEKKERVTNLVNSRVKLGITPEDEMNSEIEKFIELSDDELNLVETEFKKVEVKLSNVETNAKAKNEDSNSEIETRGLAGD